MPERVRVDLVDHSGSVVAVFENFTGLSFDRLASDKGSGQLSIPADDERYRLFDADFIWRVWYTWPEKDIGWINIFNGIHKTLVLTQAENGRLTFTSYAPDEVELLDKAFILYPSDSGKTSKSGSASTVMYAYTSENIGSGATISNGRDTDGTNPVTMQPDLSEGPSWSGKKSRKHLLTTLKEIRQYSIENGDPVDFQVQFDPNSDGLYTFAFNAGGLGVDRTIDGISPTSNGLNGAGNVPIVFGIPYGNLRRFTKSHSRYSEVNTVVVVGQGSGSSRQVVVRSGANAAASPIAQREKVVNGRSQSTNSELANFGDAKLEELSSSIKYSALPRDGAQILFRDYDLYDLVTVEDIETRDRVSRQIVKISVRVSPSEGGSIVSKDIRFSDDE